MLRKILDMLENFGVELALIKELNINININNETVKSDQAVIPLQRPRRKALKLWKFVLFVLIASVGILLKPSSLYELIHARSDTLITKPNVQESVHIVEPKAAFSPSGIWRLEYPETASKPEQVRIINNKGEIAASFWSFDGVGISGLPCFMLQLKDIIPPIPAGTMCEIPEGVKVSTNSNIALVESNGKSYIVFNSMKGKLRVYR